MGDSPLFVKTYDLLKYLMPATQKFPKSQRFVLAKRIQDAALDFYECLLQARKVDLATRRDVLLQADVELEKLRLYLRLGTELEYLKFPQYEHVSKYVTEIGRMLGAWREGTEKKIRQAVSAT
ncbi:MAG: diversity-generating retroelement protein Avd [Chloroflexi bacterium]|nr:diversity-generating retroelement protein Avd [Chloroflexota bacterium]